MIYDLAFYQGRRIAKRFREEGGILLRECSRCEKWWPAGEENYGKSNQTCDGFTPRCRACERDISSTRRKEDPEAGKRYYEKNKETIRERVRAFSAANRELIRECKKKTYERNKRAILDGQKEYYKKNREKIAERSKIYREKNRDKLLEQGRVYRLVNREKIHAAFAERYRTDPTYRIKQRFRNQVNKALKRAGATKSKRSLALLGCTALELRAHIESHFAPGMTWENHGLFGWHVDHIRPLALFDLNDPTQQAIAFHYTNLQPLWWEDNLTKSAMTPEEWRAMAEGENQPDQAAA